MVIKKPLIFLLIMAVCLELGSYGFIYYVHSTKPRLAPFLPYPDFKRSTHSLTTPRDTAASANVMNLYDFWYSPNAHFGNWHKPNTTAVHNLITTSVQYTSNSHGMRDTEREEKSDAFRIFFLGDSFVEGPGVKDDERLTNILEKKLGFEILNFGMGGNCGPAQQWLIYKHFSTIFSHDAVFLGLFPANDFWDLETTYNYNELLPSKRPFLEGVYPDYSVMYFGSGFKPPITPERKNTGGLRTVLSSCLASKNVLSYLKKQFAGQIPTVPNIHYSGYYDFTQAQWDRFRYSIEQIIATASPRPLWVFIFPYYEDYARFLQEGEAKPPLIINMEKFSKQAGFHFLDLSPYFTAQGGDMKRFHLFAEGDGHWNAEGNKLAADIIFEAIEERIKGMDRKRAAGYSSRNP